MEQSLYFTHQEVRDLAWVMASPSLLAQSQTPYAGEKVSDDWCQQVYQNNLDWLLQLDDDPTPLQQWLKQNESPLLGIYFESLLAFWIAHLSDSELLARNLVVGEPGLQIGEFDLLFKDKGRDQIIHWEAAVKFYLRYGESDYQWLGPNPRDSLQQKLNKVFNRQLRLSEHAQAQQVLQAELGRAQVISQAFIKGYLFYPYATGWQTSNAISPGVSSQHLRGWWCRHDEMVVRLRQQMDNTRRWLLPPRLEWLAPQVTMNNQALMHDGEMQEYLSTYFSEHYQASMLVEMKNVDGIWQEISRGFVVDQRWPK